MKIAVITGGDKGIGRATCLQLVADGYAIIFSYHTDKAAAEQTKKDIEHTGGKATVIQADLADEHSRMQFCAAVKKATMTITVLVHNAGSFIEGDDSNTTPAIMEKHYALHAVAAVRLCAELRPLFTNDASIINVGSVHGSLARPHAIGYSASKAALHSVTQSLAQTLAPIRVNTVSPGPVLTSMWGDLTQDEIDAIAKKSLLKRFCKPEEIANVIAFLASDKASYITGVDLLVDGGGRIR